MLVPNQTFLVSITNSNIKHYRSLGYTEPVRSKIVVPLEDLPPGSHQSIKLICDGCTNEFDREMRNYMKRHIGGKDYCVHCAFSNKTKYTNIEKYGNESTFQNEEVKEKIKETNLERYGCINAFANKEIQAKIKKTNLDKYGVSNVAKNEDIKNKIKKTVQEKYGCDSVLQSEEVKNKIASTNLDKYGVENVFANKEIQEKIKATNLEKYGVSVPSKSKKIQEKIKNTMLERYGVEYSMQSDELLSKSRETFYKNNSISTSKQQKQIYEMLSNLYADKEVQINYPYGRCSLDIALFIDDKNIDIEYDGWYWHQDLQHDRRRDEFLKSNDWKIIRIKGSHKIPTENQLQEAINRIIENEYSYTEIVLDDWKNINESRKEDKAS